MSLPHHNLVVWQRADNLFVDLHRLTHKRFPSFERFELGSQIRRSAYSVPANIVEGIARNHPKESLRFLNVASASLSECAYGIHAAARLGYIDVALDNDFEARVRMIAAPLKGLVARYRKKNPLRNRQDAADRGAKRREPPSAKREAY